MSYDLWFWKQNGACADSPAAVSMALSEGRAVVGVETIETESLLAKIQECFPAIERHHHPETGELRQLILDPSDQDWVILLEWSDSYLCVESHSAPGEILNEFIDIAWEFECPLYDPQTSTRYTG